MPAGKASFYEAKYARGEELPRSSKLMALRCLDRLGEGFRVLDIGCGSGMNSAWLTEHGHHVVGIDIAESAIRKYTERGFSGQVMDAEKPLRFADAEFDCVFCSEVIEHLVDGEALLASAYRVLRPGGRLVLTTPNSAFWLYRVLGVLGYTVSELQHPEHLRFFTRRSLSRMIRKVGFVVDQRFARNMYLIFPDLPIPGWRAMLMRLGMREEVRFRTGKRFWHLSHRARTLNGWFGETLCLVARKPDDRDQASPRTDL